MNFYHWRKINESYSFQFDPSAKYPDPDFGLTQGNVDTAKVSPGGDGGDWGGSMPRALAFAKIANDFMGKNVISSQKRSRVKTAKRTVSDHWEGSKNTYAVDLSCKGEQGDKLLAHLMDWFGYPSYKGGYWLSVNKGGYRYQIGWNLKDHYDHIHVGVRKKKFRGKDTPNDRIPSVPSMPIQNDISQNLSNPDTLIYKEERGDPYEYKIIDGIWWTKGPQIPDWTSLATNRRANQILDARYNARTPEDIAKNDKLYRKEEKGFLGIFKRDNEREEEYIPGKNSTISIPNRFESGPISVIVLYPGIAVNGEIGRAYMPPIVKGAVPDWYNKYMIVIPNEHKTPWKNVQSDIDSALEDTDLYPKSITIGIFSGSGNNSADITSYLPEISPANLLLMDPSPGGNLTKSVKELTGKSQIIMVYNPSVWGSYSGYSKLIENLKSAVNAGGVSKQVKTPHMEIPAQLLKEFKTEIEKKL